MLGVSLKPSARDEIAELRTWLAQLQADAYRNAWPTWVYVMAIMGGVAYLAMLYFIFKGQLHV